VSEQRLRAENLHKVYDGKEVVRGIDLEVSGGEVVGLLGPNGAGKTTTFSMIVGGIRPSEGRVFLDAEEVTDLPMYQRARRGLTTVEPDAQTRKERLLELLAELGLVAKSNQRADSLSGGERRRVEITRALVLDPKFLLLDEPFSGIDPIAVSDIQKIVEQLRTRGIGIVVTDHNVRETLSICNRAYIIREGEILKQGTPVEIAEDGLN
jgi:lipopolysaccharide export system ATP-binding protein